VAGLTLPKRVLFYALGGGTGHFNRAYALARQLKRIGPHLQPLILTSAPVIPPLIQEGLSVLRLPSPTEHAHSGLNSNWLGRFIQDYDPHLLVVDTHCQGVFCELPAIWPHLKAKKVFLRRDADIPIANLNYDYTWLLTPEAQGYVLNRDPHECKTFAQARLILKADLDLPLVVVAHNGPPAETQSFFLKMSLALRSENLQLRFVSFLPPQIPELMLQWVSFFPLTELMPGIDLIIGGGGYNLVAECQVLGKRALFCSFERPLDTQRLRIEKNTYLSDQLSPQDISQRIKSSLAHSQPPAQVQNQASVLAEKLFVCIASTNDEPFQPRA
jgi:hypothetical protein